MLSLKLDWKRVSLALVLILLLLTFAQAAHSVVPSEDAFITFRYARNLAEGQGLVWNPGEDPVEGSTEFLWVILLAGAYRLGLSIEQAAWILSYAAAAVTTLLVGLIAYWLSRRQILAMLLAGGAFAIGPAAYYAHFGFATNLFSLFLVGSFLAQLLCLYAQHRKRLLRVGYRLLALNLLLLSLTRPEGVLYSLLAVAVSWHLSAGETRKHLIRAVLIYLVAPGLVYFSWRWLYFGYPLPNTFYVKSYGGFLHLRYIWDIYEMFRFSAPLLLLFGCALVVDHRKRAMQMLWLFTPAFLFPWFYLLIDQTQNIGSRFQYPIYPLFLLAAVYGVGVLAPRVASPWRWRQLWEQFPRLVGTFLALFAIAVPLDNRSFLIVLALGLLLLKLWEYRDSNASTGSHRQYLYLIFTAVFTLFLLRQSYFLAKSFYHTQFDDRRAVGMALLPFADKDYTIVVSEAGWIPYFSRWRAIDSFGLNDEHIAHEGLSFDYLDSVHPDIIMYHDVARPNPPRWTDMIATLQSYVQRRGYTLAAIVERKGKNDLHIYYVRPDNPDAEALIQAITEHDQYSYQYRAP